MPAEIPKSCSQLFERSFALLLVPHSHQKREIVNALLRESLRRKASEINIEPAPDSACDIFFRINGILHKAFTASGSQAVSLREAVQSMAQDLQPGDYDVVEGRLTLCEYENENSFHYYNIPQSPFNSILIRNADTATHRSKTSGNEKILPMNSDRNVDKKIFIWQMGKVGSSTVYRSLLPYSKPCTWEVPTIKNNTYWPSYNNIIQTHSIKLLYDFLHYSDEKFVIVSLVRDLLARNISSIFQSMNDEEEWRNQHFIANLDDFQKMSYDQQEKKITQQLIRLNTGTAVTSWYDNLLRSHFYYPDIDKYFVDIYAKPFDQENGYQIYESRTSRIKMMVMRLENLNDQVDVMGDFLGIDGLHFISKNVAAEKWYNPMYKRFKERYKPTPLELEAIYNSRFMRYFYSPDQIRLLIEKWTTPR